MFTEELLRSFKDNIAVITDEGESISYQVLLDFSEQLYEKVSHRCLVFCLCKNSLGSLKGYVSFIKNKIVPLLLDSAIDKKALDNLITLYQPHYMWMPSARITDFEKLEIIFEAQDYTLVFLNPQQIFPIHDELALLLTTSGSTGSPKLVRVSYENILSNAKSIANFLSISTKERPVTVLPMNYSYGLSVINSHLLEGATILLNKRSLMEKEFWSFIKKENATSLSGVPYTYEILSKLRFSKMHLPAIRTLTQAGGKLSAELWKEFAEYCDHTGKSFFVMYGQTEATARISYLASGLTLSKIGSIGKAIPGGRLSLRDENGVVIENNETVGELVYQGRNVAMGYANQGQDLCKHDENLCNLFTGDMAKRDNDGFYYIVGRQKRFIKLFGNRIGLDEMEVLLRPLVTECACVGVDNKLTIYITDESRKEEVHSYVSNKTGINQSAFIIQTIESIPKNISGKIMYSNLEINL